MMFFGGTAIYMAGPGLDWRFSYPLITLGVGLAGAALCAKGLDRRPLLEMLAMWWHGRALRQLGAGIGLTLGMMILLVALELVFGDARMLSAHVTFGHSLSVLFLGFLSFTLVGFSEEILVRGYPFTVLLRQGGVAAALLLTSGVFSIMHAFNPGIGWFGFLNIFLAGIWLGLARVVSGSLWLPVGLHIGWNFFLGPVFGFPVSGIIERSVLITITGRPDWLTGGAFGPEGGLLATVVLIAGTAVLYLPGMRKFLDPGLRSADVGGVSGDTESEGGHMVPNDQNEHEVRE